MGGQHLEGGLHISWKVGIGAWDACEGLERGRGL